METPTVNDMFIARRKKDGGWDVAVSSSLADLNTKMDDVKAGGMHDFVIEYKHPKAAAHETLTMSPAFRAGANLPVLFGNEGLYTSHYDLVASGDLVDTLSELLKIQKKEAIRGPEFSLNERSSSIIVMPDNQAFSFLFCSRHPCFCSF